MNIGHVRDVQEHRKNEISYLITANVIRQVNVTNPPYAVKFDIDVERLITNVSCTCVYGARQKCKHVAALLHYVNKVESLTKTSFEHEWGRPTAGQFALQKYSKGYEFEVMFPSSKKVFVEPPPLDISELKEPSALRNIVLEATKDANERDERIAKKLRLEKDALKEYERLKNVPVQNFGLIVFKKQPWLCASPDGAVMRDNSIEKIVEFKCPSSCANVAIVDYKAKKYNVGYLKIKENNVIEFKESALYYTQCQVQMYVTGTSVCDLYVYSPIQNGSCCIPVTRNEDFLSKVISKSQEFYFQYIFLVLYQKLELEAKKLSKSIIEKKEMSKRTFTGNNISNNICV